MIAIISVVKSALTNHPGNSEYYRILKNLLNNENCGN